MNNLRDLQGDVSRLFGSLRRIEERLSLVERAVGTAASEGVPNTAAASPAPSPSGGALSDDVALEYKIGELWVGQVGAVALLMGVAFFISYPFGEGLAPFLQGLVGFLAVGALIGLSRRWQDTYPPTARILSAGALLLLYLVTLRLHFFTPHPVVPQKAVGLLLLVLCLGSLLYVAIRRRSTGLACLVLFLGFVTSLLSDTSHFALMLNLATVAAALFTWLRYGWPAGILMSVVLAYATHLIWVFNNPVLGHPIHVVAAHHYNLGYLFGYAALFGIAGLGRREDTNATSTTVPLALLNGAGLCSLGAIVGLSHFRGDFGDVNLMISVACLCLASAHWVRHQSKLVTSLYACFGYMALSVAIVTYTGSPDRFLWLGWQSLLVISTAIWFRSRLVVVANVLIYLAILAFYLLLEPPDLAVNLSYAAVALLSARVMNWQKERLALKTELMRNTYLASAFVVVPFGLYNGVPDEYVSSAWLAAALFYFALSLVLRNRKYRWMAILTMLLTVLYVFVVDLAVLSPVYRMISFLVLGVTMLGVSWVYARYRKRGERVEGNHSVVA